MTDDFKAIVGAILVVTALILVIVCLGLIKSIGN